MAYPSVSIDELVRRGWTKSADGALLPPPDDYRFPWRHKPYLVDPDEVKPPLPAWMADGRNQY